MKWLSRHISKIANFTDEAIGCVSFIIQMGEKCIERINTTGFKQFDSGIRFFVWCSQC